MWLINSLQEGTPTGIAGWVFLVLAGGFWGWMLVDSIQRQEYFWSFFIFVFSLLSAVFYYFFVYRQASPTSVRGFELPGAQQRQRIKELEAQIHHLDKAHHHQQLGDVYFQQGKLQKAEACYRAALERDAEDLETRSHLGQCLLRQGRAAEALPLLESVSQQDPKHEYGYTLMAYAEALTAVGEANRAIEVWIRVNEEHSYTRARVQLAEMYLQRGQTQDAKPLLDEVLKEDAHTPAFQRKRDKVWIRRAKALSRKV